MIRCTHCGNEMEDGLMLCPYCSAAPNNDDAVIEKVLSDPPEHGSVSVDQETGPLKGALCIPDEPDKIVPPPSDAVVIELEYDARQQDPTEREVREIMDVLQIDALSGSNDVRRRILFFLGIVLLGSLLWFCVQTIFGYSPLVARSETVEAADQIDPLSLVTLSDHSANQYTYTLKESALIPNVPGTYNITYTLRNNSSGKTKDITFLFRVVDTTAPIIEAPKTIQIIQNGTFRIEDFIAVSDNSRSVSAEQLYVGGSVDTQTPGDYPLTLSLTDSSGNTTIVNITVSVIAQSAEDGFFDLIYGTWEYGSQLITFTVIDGVCYLNTENHTGSLKFLSVDENGTQAELSWNWTDDSGSETHTSDISIDASHAQDGYLSVSLSDSSGWRNYWILQNN